MSVFVTRYFFWDTETTGNSTSTDDIISIGGVLCEYKNGKFHKIEEFNSFVSTNKKIDPVAQSIHHISKSDLMNQPEFPDVMRMLRTFLQQYQPESNSRLILVAHNGSRFDDIILYCNFIQHRMDFDQFMKDIKCYGFIDTLKYLKVLFKGCQYKDSPKDSTTGRSSFALGHCYTSFCGATELSGAHDALVDSRAMFDVMNSVAVCQRVNLQNLFKNTVHKKKALNWIKQTAGIAFQNKEQHTKLAKTQDAVIENMDGDAGSSEVLVVTDPVFEDETDFLEGNSPYHRLCLACMRFVKKDEHVKCESDVQGFQKKVTTVVAEAEDEMDPKFRPDSPPCDMDEC
jgi:DNA polymerase III epsilon subunit-like protein